MSDIFISYSRKDSEQATQLAELLRSTGLSVWMDQTDIELATSWSGEIVDAIDHASAVLVLLSSSSVDSRNVLREVALAFEKEKKILPIEIEPIALTRDLQYHLAGLQRSSITNIDAIVRALDKLGLHAKQAPVAPSITKNTYDRKSLMILPFEDLSPTRDNEWFADGIASELTSALSNVRALRVIDWNTSREFKDRRVRTTLLAKELEIRYFVEGQVRKFGDQIKISITLLDIETGDHLWQESLKGTMEHVFEIQENVAERVVDNLKIHLAEDEEKKLQERGTTNPEAYELYLKANKYYTRFSRETFHLALQQLKLVLELDPEYAQAMVLRSTVLSELYKFYDRNPQLLAQAEVLAKTALEMKPNHWQSYGALSTVYLRQGRLEEAENAALEYVRRAPNESGSHNNLAYFYGSIGQVALSISHFEAAVELQPTALNLYFSLVIECDRAHDTVRTRTWAERALPYYERHLRLVPDDDDKRVWYANMLRYAGKPDYALEAIEPLRNKQNIDPGSIYNIACLYCSLGKPHRAVDSLQLAVEGGYADIETLHKDPDLDPLRELPAFKAILEKVDQVSKPSASLKV